MRTYKIYFIVFAVFLLISVASCTKDKAPESAQSKASITDLMASLEIQHVTETVKAPDFELVSVKGEKISLHQYQGKVVLLSVWATW